MWLVHQHRYRASPSAQKAILGSAILDEQTKTEIDWLTDMSDSKKKSVVRKLIMGRWGERKVFREKVGSEFGDIWTKSSKYWQHSKGPDKGLCFARLMKTKVKMKLSQRLANGRRRSQNNRDPTVYTTLQAVVGTWHSLWRWRAIGGFWACVARSAPMAEARPGCCAGEQGAGQEGGAAMRLLQRGRQHAVVV